MIKKVVIALFAALAAFALIPATGAFASGPSHHIGKTSSSCFTNTAGGYNGVLVGIAGLGSDSPKNAYVAGRANISANGACNKAGNVALLRVQVDRIALLKGNAPIEDVYNKGNGTASIAVDTPFYHGSVPCGTSLKIFVAFSGRYADGTLAKGSTYGVPFTRC